VSSVSLYESGLCSHSNNACHLLYEFI
jgi:hypothetical protein